MKLRPHHFLCTQGYSGKGYSEEFVENMDRVTNILRNEKNFKIDLVFSTDEICSKCPDILGKDLCRNNEKVKMIDGKVVSHFNLEEKEYDYLETVEYIKDNMTAEIMDDICGTCQWYSMSKCKKVMCREI